MYTDFLIILFFQNKYFTTKSTKSFCLIEQSALKTVSNPENDFRPFVVYHETQYANAQSLAPTFVKKGRNKTGRFQMYIKLQVRGIVMYVSHSLSPSLFFFLSFSLFSCLFSTLSLSQCINSGSWKTISKKTVRSVIYGFLSKLIATAW